MNKRFAYSMTLILGAIVSAGCGDDGDEESMQADSGMVDAGGGIGGGGGGGMGGTGGSSVPTSVECGTSTCEAPAAAAGFITACCANEATSTCGVSLMGAACAEPAEGDARCPGVDIMGFIMLPSCCTDGGQCGIDASMFGMPGCIDLATAAEQAAMMGMGSGDALPEPRACGDDGDGGIDDAGGTT